MGDGFGQNLVWAGRNLDALFRAGDLVVVGRVLGAFERDDVMLPAPSVKIDVIPLG
ncbi:MAG: hypothetical protein WBN43_04135 [Thiogranum sp.]